MFSISIAEGPLGAHRRAVAQHSQKCQTVGQVVRLEPLQAPPCATVDSPAGGDGNDSPRVETPDQCEKGFTRALLKAAEGDAKIHPEWSRRELCTFIYHLYLKICGSCNLQGTCLISVIMHIFNMYLVFFVLWHYFSCFLNVASFIFVFGPGQSNGAANWTVNQRRETWKSLDCGHSSEAVQLEMERKTSSTVSQEET